MKIVLIGCPGAGKGTQAKLLAAKYGIHHLATGDLFRAEIAAKSPLGDQVADYLRSGTLVPDDLVVTMVAGKLGDTGSYILDGFPRTMEQAQALDKILHKNGQQIDLVIYINMKESDVIRRLAARRSCVKCGALYNLETKPPVSPGKCDTCGVDIVQRDDDKESTVKKRLMVYEDLTAPLIAYYRSESTLVEVDGSLPIEEVTQTLTAIVDKAQVKA